MNIEIPDGLGDMLRDFTVAVLREKPGDLYEFATEYFAKAKETRKPSSVPMYVIVDDDEEAGEPDMIKFKPKTNKNFARRHSVSAERYDPEADDNDEEKVVHPKTDEQRKRLEDAVRNILIFKSLDPDQIQDVLDAMFERIVEPEELVIKQGDDGDNFYVIDNGKYDVIVNINGEDKAVHQFCDQGSFGELALMYNMPRSATIKALIPGTLWAMDRGSFRRIVQKAAFKRRKMYEELLESVTILKSLESYERLNLADALVTKSYNDNEAIISQGDSADGMYFMETGTIRVVIRKPDGKEEEVGRHSKGKYFGELALLENKPRSATVIAVGKVKVAFLDRGSFERLLGPCVDIMKRNMEVYKQFAGK